MPKTSKLAITSLILGTGGWILLGPFAPITGLILGIIAIVGIKSSRGSLKGWPFAIAGITISAAPIILVGVFILLSPYLPLCFLKILERAPETVLKSAHLAPLPESATGFQAEGWSRIFTGGFYLMFHATPEDINGFLVNSPSIKSVSPEIFNPNYTLLTAPTDANCINDGLENMHKHRYLHPSRNEPNWYNPTIKVKGRRYKITPRTIKNFKWGEVIVNDETNTVYVKITWPVPILP